MIHTFNPATEKKIAEYQTFSEQELVQILDASLKAFKDWKKISHAERSLPLLALAKLLRQDETLLSELITCEMGKPISQSRCEVEKCAFICEFFAEHAQAYLTPECVELSSVKKSTIVYEPLGVIYSIMPWNYPLSQIIRSAIPALMAGNTVVLKQAPNVTGLALHFEKLFQAAGFPRDVYRTLVLDNTLAESVISMPQIAGITFTGSQKTGLLLAERAGRAFKKIVLEMGGSDPYLVLEDADLDLAASQIVTSRMNNAGQVCISAKRAIICRDVYQEMKEKILSLMSSYHPGDPLKPQTQLGPLARKDLIVQLQQQVDKSLSHGARLLLGGQPLQGTGYFYPPTVLEHVQKGMAVFDEETFGPVLPLILAEDEHDAIIIANNHPYALSAVVFTSNLERGERIARDELEAGLVHVNHFVSSHPALPFGGTKKSGLGRELGREGIRTFTNVKPIIVGS